MKKNIITIILLAIIFIASGCTELETTEEITSIKIKELNKENYYSWTTIKDNQLEIEYYPNITKEDIEVVNSNENSVGILYEVVESEFGNYVKFDIYCKEPGQSEFYFQTTDERIKSNTIKIDVKQNLKKINIESEEELTIYTFSTDKKVEFTLESYEEHEIHSGSLNFVSENPDIATIRYDTDSWFYNYFIIEKVSPGETYVYISSTDNSIQSQKIKVIVEKEEETTNTNTYIEEDNSRIVYTTPYGEKYHYSKACAGKNARETTENKAKGIYDPCKKCAH